MRILKKVFKFSGSSFILLLLSLMIYACASVPKLSKEEKRLISQVVRAPIPNAIKGETGFAASEGYKIWFERINSKDASNGTIVLIMGNGNDALTWPTSFVNTLVGRGYQVIRFDHRGTGLSTS